MAKSPVRCLPALALALMLPMGAHAAEANPAVSKQMATASAHAGMAMGATDLKTTQMHLHHVVNCLEGPSGKSFDSNAGDPCKGMGQGAIVDAKGDAATEARLQTALTDAKQGLAATTLDAAHAGAQKTMSTLQQK